MVQGTLKNVSKCIKHLRMNQISELNTPLRVGMPFNNKTRLNQKFLSFLSFFLSRLILKDFSLTWVFNSLIWQHDNKPANLQDYRSICSNLLKVLLRCNKRPHKWNTQWDTKSLLKVCWSSSLTIKATEVPLPCP